MYGTVATMRVLATNNELPDELARQMQLDRPPGLVAGYVFAMDADPRTYVMVAIFESKDAYLANAESAQQRARYDRIRALLSEDPEWHDGEIRAQSGKP